jgi:8-oxo-dGTP pyrophosphatase MutT (NUDIX family)
MNETRRKKPAITVASVLARDGRFLVVEEWAGDRLVINQPAGHLEAGESVLEAVVRETREETGWGFRPDFLIGVYLWEHPSRSHSYLRLAFGGVALDYNPDAPLDEGIVRPLWLTPEELESRREDLRSPLVLRCVCDCLDGERYPLGLLKTFLADRGA